MDLILFTMTAAGYLAYQHQRSLEGRGGERPKISIKATKHPSVTTTTTTTVANSSSPQDIKKIQEIINGNTTPHEQQQHCHHHQHMMRSTKTARKLAKKWLTSFRGTDPRWKLAQFFSVELVYCRGQKQQEEAKEEDEELNSTILLQRTSSQLLTTLPPPTTTATSSVFTVWRPTSVVAIRLMMAGKATGKGLEVKGKSAKAGLLSGFVPFLQIHEEPHKTAVATISKTGRVRVFFSSRQQRNVVLIHVQRVRDDMIHAVEQAKSVILKSIGKCLKHPTSTNSRLTNGSNGEADPSSLGAGVQKAIGKFKKSGKAKSSPTSPPASSRKPASSLPMSVKGFGVGVSQKTGKDSDEREMALHRLLLWDMIDPSIEAINEYAEKSSTTCSSSRSTKKHHSRTPCCCYGIDMPNRVLWQALVVDADISRPVNGPNKQHFTGRPSQPAFQDLNWMAINKTRGDGSGTSNTTSKERDGAKQARRVVLWYIDRTDSDTDDSVDDDNNDINTNTHNNGDSVPVLDPRNLVMAYEEHGRVLPVVSDFDCFTMGTRGIDYKNSSLPADQVDLLQWCLDRIECVLDKQQQQQQQHTDARTNWTSEWLEVLKASAVQGFHPVVPEFGFGDVQSYQIMERAVAGLQETGAVRHGAECFNYYFPQELDTEFLIVYDEAAAEGLQPIRQQGDTSKQKAAVWQYVNVQQLQTFLLEKIKRGFTLPLNPKWILCDQHWKNVYNQLLSSHRPNVQDSLNVWFPPDSGIRQRIESISTRHPNGFVVCSRPKLGKDGVEEEEEVCGTEAMDLATLELDRYMTLRRAKAKIRAAMKFGYLSTMLRQEHAEIAT